MSLSTKKSWRINKSPARTTHSASHSTSSSKVGGFVLSPFFQALNKFDAEPSRNGPPDSLKGGAQPLKKHPELINPDSK